MSRRALNSFAIPEESDSESAASEGASEGAFSDFNPSVSASSSSSSTTSSGEPSPSESATDSSSGNDGDLLSDGDGRQRHGRRRRRRRDDGHGPTVPPISQILPPFGRVGFTSLKPHQIAVDIFKGEINYHATLCRTQQHPFSFRPP